MSCVLSYEQFSSCKKIFNGHLLIEIGVYDQSLPFEYTILLSPFHVCLGKYLFLIEFHRDFNLYSVPLKQK